MAKVVAERLHGGWIVHDHLALARRRPWPRTAWQHHQHTVLPVGGLVDERNALWSAASERMAEKDGHALGVPRRGRCWGTGRRVCKGAGWGGQRAHLSLLSIVGVALPRRGVMVTSTDTFLFATFPNAAVAGLGRDGDGVGENGLHSHRVGAEVPGVHAKRSRSRVNSHDSTPSESNFIQAMSSPDALHFISRQRGRHQRPSWSCFTRREGSGRALLTRRGW